MVYCGTLELFIIQPSYKGVSSYLASNPKLDFKALATGPPKSVNYGPKPLR